jgi:hypothetical protein
MPSVAPADGAAGTATGRRKGRTMIIPTVHLNGDSKQTLLDDNLAARRAVRDALDAVAKASPNGRNFYPQGDGAITKAVTEHRIRLLRLEEVRQELETILEGIQDQ